MAWWDATQAEAMACQSTKELIPEVMFVSCGKLSEEDDKCTHAAIFEVKFGKKAEEATTDSRKRTADTHFNDLGSVALTLESSDLSITEDNFVPTARCIQDTKERQLVTRSGLQAMKTPYLGRQFFKTLLQKIQYYMVDAIAGDANAAAYKNYISSVAIIFREMQREVNMGRPSLFLSASLSK